MLTLVCLMRLKEQTVFNNVKTFFMLNDITFIRCVFI